LRNAGGGITEWVKAEDLERMESYVETSQDQQAQDEEAFDIF
jgi:penicillin-binding protein 1A